MDTGLGKDGFSVIGQGKIEEILTLHAEERRGLIEEAAGISKYKYRKREAERKLESTTDDMTRLDDILYELEQRIVISVMLSSCASSLPLWFVSHFSLRKR